MVLCLYDDVEEMMRWVEYNENVMGLRRGGGVVLRREGGWC